METRPNRSGHFLHGTLQTFEWHEVINWLRAETQSRQKNHNALTLVKNEALSVVMLYFQKEAQMHEHHAPGQFTLTVLEGRINFLLYLKSETISTELSQGQLLVLEEPTPHAIIALEESAFLLTIIAAR